MKYLLFVCLTIATASATEIALRVPAILRQVQQLNPDGSYSNSFETENGISQSAQGALKNAGTDSEAEVSQGAFSYIGPEGEKVGVEYVADEGGYQPKGSHIAPIPPLILRALAWIAAHPPKPNTIENGRYVQQN